jgi:hypothetical protein
MSFRDQNHPDERPAPHLPDLDKPGDKIFEEGYTQASRAYCMVSEPPPEGATVAGLLQMIRDKDPTAAAILEDRLLETARNAWRRAVGKTYGLTYRQFDAFKAAEKLCFLALEQVQRSND